MPELYDRSMHRDQCCQIVRFGGAPGAVERIDENWTAFMAVMLAHNSAIFDLFSAILTQA